MGLPRGFAMTGWRLGYMAAPLDLVNTPDKLLKPVYFRRQFYSTTGGDYGSAGRPYTSFDMVKAFKERKSTLYRHCRLSMVYGSAHRRVLFTLSPIFLPSLVNPTGRLHLSIMPMILAVYLLNTAHVIDVSGAAFGDEQCIRFFFYSFHGHLDRRCREDKRSVGCFSVRLN